MDKYLSYADWQAACRARGLEGPYKIYGWPQWQYIGEAGTAALYHLDKGYGFVWGEAKRVPTP